MAPPGSALSPTAFHYIVSVLLLESELIFPTPSAFPGTPAIATDTISEYSDELISLTARYFNLKILPETSAVSCMLSIVKLVSRPE